MNTLLSLHQIYRLDNNQWLEDSNLPAKTSQLNLFSNENIETQIEYFKQLISHFQFPLSFQIKQHNKKLHWDLYANYSDLILLKEKLLESNFDYLLWPEQIINPPKLMVFDMDSTFIQIEVIDELAKQNHVGEKVSQVTEQAMRGELDFTESLIARVACLKGLSSSAINQVADNLPLSDGVEQLVTSAAQSCCETSIVSGGFMPFVEKIKQQMKLYKVEANQLEIIDNQLTGKLLGKIIDAQEKEIFLNKTSQSLSLEKNQVMAIGDGANDLTMMQAAGFSLAYQAKPKVEQQANGRIKYTSLDRLCDLFGWPAKTSCSNSNL